MLNLEDFFKIFGRFFKIRVNIIKYRILKCLEDAKWVDDYHSPFTPQIVQKCLNTKKMSIFNFLARKLAENVGKYVITPN